MDSGFHGVMDINPSSGVMMRVKLELLHDLRRGLLALAKQEFVCKNIEPPQLFKVTRLTAYVFDVQAELEMLNDSRTASQAYKTIVVSYHMKKFSSFDGQKLRTKSQIKRQLMLLFVQFEVIF